MKSKNHSLGANKIKFAFGAALLAALTGSLGCVERSHVVVHDAPYAFVAQDDYVYYPGYDVYYSSHRHQYAYLDGGAWVSRPAPRGVSVVVLRASPSVKMDFHDAPAHHHAEIVQQYPKNWAPPGSHPAQRENPNNGQRDEHNGK